MDKTPEEWAKELSASEQRIVNIAFGWATATNNVAKAHAADRLYGAVWEHHRMLETASKQRPTMPAEIAQARVP